MVRTFGQQIGQIGTENSFIAKKSHIAGFLILALSITLISASVAESAHGDETAATSTPPDAATMPLMVEPLIETTDPQLSSSTTSELLVASTTTSTSTANETRPETPGTDQIQTYKVKSGDTLSTIAEHFHISLNTIVWANNINPKTALKEGQSLVILPISGVEYTVKQGDNLQSIANKFKGDVDEIVAFNNLQDSGHVKAGDTIVIPDGDMSSVVSKPVPKQPQVSSPASNTNINSTAQTLPQSSSAGLIRPLIGGTKTQGIHGHNAVDLASSINTPIIAAAAGTVLVAKEGGWNGGYGNYIVIDHGNGIQTLYAHLNSVSTSVGSIVSQGQTIGAMGQTGDSTGVHLHFEVRGGTNPF